jgi:hypothetical protein
VGSRRRPRRGYHQTGGRPPHHRWTSRARLCIILGVDDGASWGLAARGGVCPHSCFKPKDPSAVGTLQLLSRSVFAIEVLFLPLLESRHFRPRPPLPAASSPRRRIIKPYKESSSSTNRRAAMSSSRLAAPSAGAPRPSSSRRRSLFSASSSSSLLLFVMCTFVLAAMLPMAAAHGDHSHGAHAHDHEEDRCAAPVEKGEDTSSL